MKKLTSLAMIGMSMSLLMGGCREAKGEEMSSEMRAFYEQLNPETQKKFLKLDSNHRKMAMENATSGCSSPNVCGGRIDNAVHEQYSHQMQERQKLNNKMQ